MKDYTTERRPRSMAIGKDEDDYGTKVEVDNGRHRRRHQSSHIPRERSLSRTDSLSSIDAPRSSTLDSGRRRRRRRESTGQQSEARQDANERTSDRSRRSLPLHLDTRTSNPRGSHEPYLSRGSQRSRNSFSPREQTKSTQHRDSLPLSRSSSAKEPGRKSSRGHSQVSSRLDSERDIERKQRHRRSMGDDLAIRSERESRMRREHMDDEEEYRPRRFTPGRQDPPTNKEKRQMFLEKAKWLALLPLALRTINILAEPSGGWEQWHKGDEKMGKAPRVKR